MGARALPLDPVGAGPVPPRNRSGLWARRGDGSRPYAAQSDSRSTLSAMTSVVLSISSIAADRHDAPAAERKPASDREPRVAVGRSGALDAPDDTPARVRDEVSGDRPEHVRVAGSHGAQPSERPGGERRATHGLSSQDVNRSERHLRLVTETIEAVNSTLDLDELFELIAAKVAAALEADACFVYLYDERAGELVLKAVVGSRVEAETQAPKMRPGEGITGTAALERAPIMIASAAHLDPRFKRFPNLHEEQYESILAVPILAKEPLEGALNVRTIEPRDVRRGRDRPADGDRRSGRAGDREREALRPRAAAGRRARGARVGSRRRCPSRSTSRSRSRRSSRRRCDAVGATGAAIVLEDGRVVWPEGRAGSHAERLPLRWKGRQIGELVCDRDAPFTDEETDAARVDRPPRGGRTRARPRGHARRPRPGDPPPREEQPPDRRLDAPPAGPLDRRRRRVGRSRTPSTGSSRSPPCTRC